MERIEIEKVSKQRPERARVVRNKSVAEAPGWSGIEMAGKVATASTILGQLE